MACWHTALLLAVGEGGWRDGREGGMGGRDGWKAAINGRERVMYLWYTIPSPLTEIPWY